MHYPEFKELEIGPAKLFLAPLKNRHSTVLTLNFQSGSFFEDKKTSGYSHFLEHIFFKGSKKYPNEQKVGEAIEKYGGQVNAFTSFEMTGFWMHVPKSAFEKTLPILFDIVFNPTAIKNKKEVNKEKLVIIEEIKRDKDNPDWYIEQKAYNQLNPKHPISREIIGSKENIQKINTKKIINWWKKHYAPNNLQMSIAGYVPEKIEKKIKKLLPQKMKTKVINRPKYTSPRKTRFKAFTRKIDQIKFRLMFDDDSPLTLKQKLILDIIEKILGQGLDSILFTELRSKEALCYDINASSDIFKDFSLFEISSGFAQKQIEKAIQKIIAVLNKIKKEGFDKNKFQDAKNFVLGQIEMQIDDLNLLAYWPINDLRLFERLIPFPEIIQTLKEIKLNDINNFANNLFQNKNASLVTLGNYKNEIFLGESLNQLL